MAKQYKVLTGMNYPVNGVDKRVEVGEIVDDIPVTSIPWLLQDGHIEEVAAPAPPIATVTPAATGGDH